MADGQYTTRFRRDEPAFRAVASAGRPAPARSIFAHVLPV